MTSGRLFLKRFKAESRFHFETFNYVVPKLYWFYILGPYMFFIVAFYRELWENPFDYWPQQFPFFVMLGLAMLFLSFDSFRSYVQSADLLYILHQKKLIKGLRLYGFLVSIITSLLQIVPLIIILLPVLRTVEPLTVNSIGLLALLLFAYKMLGMLLRKTLLYHWFGKVLGLLLFALILFLYRLTPMMILTVSMIAIIAVVLIYLRGLDKSVGFYQEIALEAKEKHRFVWLILLASALGSLMQGKKPPLVPQLPAVKFNRPQLLFRNSKAIFSRRSPDNGLLEFALKAFLRSDSKRNAYLLLTIIPAGLGLFLPPIPQTIIFIIMIIGSWMFASGAFDKIATHDFFKIVPIEKEVQERTDSRFCVYLVTFAMMLAVLSWLVSGLI